MKQPIIIEIVDMKQPKQTVCKYSFSAAKGQEHDAFLEYDYQFNFTLTKEGINSAKTVQNNQIKLVVEKSGKQIIKFDGFSDWQLNSDELTLTASSKNSIEDEQLISVSDIRVPLKFYYPPKIVKEEFEDL